MPHCRGPLSVCCTPPPPLQNCLSPLYPALVQADSLFFICLQRIVNRVQFAGPASLSLLPSSIVVVCCLLHPVSVRTDHFCYALRASDRGSVWVSWFSLIVVHCPRYLCLRTVLSLVLFHWLINFSSFIVPFLSLSLSVSLSLSQFQLGPFLDCFSAVYQRFITLTFCQFDCF